MSKKITIEIIKTTAGIGKQGEIKEVSIAQARNQLIPQGIAKEASTTTLDTHKKQEDNKQALQDQRHDIVEKLRSQSLEVSVEAHGSRINHHF